MKTEAGSKAARPRRPRRWASLSLRGMLILILVVGGLMGWKARRVSLRRRAVARVESLQGRIVYDWQPQRPHVFAPTARPFGWSSPPWASTVDHPPGPAWLRRMLGDDYFQEVVEVGVPIPYSSGFFVPELEDRRDNDQLACLDGLDRIETLSWGKTLRSEGLDRLKRLTGLKELTANYRPQTAGAVKAIANLARLERLDIQLDLPDDAPLAEWERLTRLKTLLIFDASRKRPDGAPSQITDAWLARLGRYPSLAQLEIWGTNARITDAGLAHLQGLKGLESLGLHGVNGVSDAGLAHLGSLENLRFLNLSSASEIGDEGLAHLKNLKHLENLFLDSATGVTDAGLARLEALPSLAWIKLPSASRVTDVGVESLAKLPALKGLELNAKSLTDAGLARLGSIKTLKDLTLKGAEIKGEILDGIKAAIPGVSLNADRLEDAAGAPASDPGGPK